MRSLLIGALAASLICAPTISLAATSSAAPRALGGDSGGIRVGSPLGQASSLEGNTLYWVLGGAVALILFFVLVLDDDDDDEPVSP